MAKKGMKHYYTHDNKSKVPPVPEIQGKAKRGKTKTNPLIAGIGGMVYHSTPHSEDKIPAVFPAIDNDLAVENLTDHFDTTAADRQDLQ